MSSPKIPQIEGITVMSPLEMNDVRFDKKHTVLTPEVLAANSKTQDGKASENRDSLNSSEAH